MKAVMRAIILRGSGIFASYMIKREDMEKFKREIASICMPGYEKKVVDERVLRIPVINGAMLEPRQSKPFRPAVKAEGVKGLYFTGDTVRGEGCSGDIAFSSAFILDDIIGGY